MTKTNSDLQRSVQKVTDAQEIFLKLGYTGKFDDLTALNRFFRRTSMDLSPNSPKVIQLPDQEKEKAQQDFKKISAARDILTDREALQVLTAAVTNEQHLLDNAQEKLDQTTSFTKAVDKDKIATLKQKAAQLQEELADLLNLSDKNSDLSGNPMTPKEQERVSEALLINFQNQARKVTEDMMRDLPNKMEPITDLAQQQTTIFQKFTESTLTAEQIAQKSKAITDRIKKDIIDPYLKTLNLAYNPQALEEMIEVDQIAAENAYNKGIASIKNEIIKNLTANISNQALQDTIIQKVENYISIATMTAHIQTTQPDTLTPGQKLDQL
jgi:hypothetical protein